jgi:hypothetical protein
MLTTYDGSNFMLPNDGSKVTDISGNGYHGTAIDLSRSTESIIGSSAGVFNGSTSCVEVPFIRNDLFKTPYTMNLWVYPNDDDRAIYFGDYSITPNNANMNFERVGGGALRYYHAAQPDYTFSNTKSPSGKWSMITFTSDGTNLKGYVNGVLTDTKTFTPTITKNAGIMRIGRDSRSDYTALDGKVADFRWYATALSEDDIEILYKAAGSVDNNQNLWSNEIVEDGESEYIDITKKH